MAFDDTKTTEDGDGTVDSDEQVGADEWNAMVADQQSRVLFGTLAERPAAGEVENGTPYLVTDLANDGGVITKVVGGSWQIQQIGDETNRPDIVGGSADLETVSTNRLNNTFVAQPGDLQDTLSKLSASNLEYLILSGDYVGEGTLAPPFNTQVISFGARIEPTSATIGVNLSAGKIRLAGQLYVDTQQVTTPDAAVLVDTSESDRSLRLVGADHISAPAQIHIRATSGDGLRLKTDSGHNITFGNKFNISVAGADNHLVLDTNGGFINGGEINLHSRNYGNRSIIHKSSTSNPAAAGININGQIQTEETPDHAIESTVAFADFLTGAERSVTFSGHLYDPNAAAVSGVSGDALRVDVKNATQTGAVSFGEGSVINGIARQASDGVPVQKGQIYPGDIVVDTVNDGYYFYSSEQIMEGPLFAPGSRQSGGQVTIADDSVATFDATEKTHLNVSNGNQAGGIFYSAFNILNSAATGPNTSNQGTTSLTGTTGPDGSLNISRDGNTVNVENRLGQSESILVNLVGPR